MDYHYKCIKCNSFLRVRENIILKFRSDLSKKEGIILLDPRLGNYGFIVHNTVLFQKDEVVNFYCPVCHADLSAKSINPNLVHIIMIDKDNKEYDVFFSKVAGERSTFKFDKENIIEKYGDDASGYQGYFSSKLKKQLKDSANSSI
jgi:hypothetical protein